MSGWLESDGETVVYAEWQGTGMHENGWRFGVKGELFIGWLKCK